ncbi:MAG: general secretion pathway protein GspB [Elusimicrobiota bacterium]|jgi:hypothetical protein
MMNKSSVGWVLLVVALAVPGLLFYRWYAHQDRAQKKELNVKVRSRIPEGGPFATPPSNSNKLVNPMSVAAQPKSAPAAPAAPAPKTAAAPALPKPMMPVPAMPKPAAPAPALPAPAMPAPALPAPAEPPPDAKAYLSWRDPTLSPYDQVQLDREEAERQMRLQDFQNQPAMPRARRRRPSTAINLQGIVSSEGTNRAIINGEIVRQGQTINGVKIIRITPQSVIFMQNNKRFTKTISR